MRVHEQADINTAYHEAGHAVIAIVLGIGVRYTTIRARLCDYLGVTYYSSGRSFDETHIKTCFAGEVAEQRHLGHRPHPCSAASDRAHVESVIKRLTGYKEPDGINYQALLDPD